MNPPLKLWVAGTRPRTLPAAVVPVAVGTAVGYQSSGRFVLTTPQLSSSCHSAVCTSFVRELNWLNVLLALIVALGIQIGTNYVNDYADGVRGTDEHRVGPVRLVAGRLATVHQVKVAALASFAVAGVAGFILAARVTWWFIPLGLLCGVAGWAYTGGPRPYGYLGFGEVFVFVFFGLVATAGSAYVQHAPLAIEIGSHAFAYSYNWAFALWAGVPVGLLAAALLQADNFQRHRDRHGVGQEDVGRPARTSTGGVPLHRNPDGCGGGHRHPGSLQDLVAPRPGGLAAGHPPGSAGARGAAGEGTAPHARKHGTAPDGRGPALDHRPAPVTAPVTAPMTAPVTPRQFGWPARNQ